MSLDLTLVLFIVNAIAVSGIAVFVWGNRRSNERATRFMTLLLGAIVFWTLAYSLELFIPDAPLKLVFWRLKFFGVVSVTLMWLLLSLELADLRRWASGWRLAVLIMVPLVFNLLVWTNEWHRWVWSDVTIVPFDARYTLVRTVEAVGFYLHTYYSYAVLLSGVVILARFFLRAPKVYRGQLIALVVAMAAPVTANVVTVFYRLPIDVTPFAFGITGISMAVGVLRYRLMLLAPAARDLVIDSMNDAVIVVDESDQVIDMNRAAAHLVGRSARNAVGVPIAQMVPGLLPATGTQFNAQKRNENEYRLTERESGEARIYAVRASPIYDSRYGLIGQVIVLQDITARRQAEQRIQEQNEALLLTNKALDLARERAEEGTRVKDQFLANISHELRTPLNAILGFSEILLSGIGGELTDQQTHYQQRILANSEQLLRLINELLDIAKIDAKQMTVEEQPFLLRPWFDNVVDSFRHMAEGRGLEFICTFDASLPETVVGDAMRLGQVLGNLTANAVKFTEKGRVSISAQHRDDTTWALVVADTGIGIPEEAHGYIFEPFRQVDGSTQRRFGGTGLGLAIVHQLIDLMGGHITLESTVDRGTTFTVTLPLKLAISQTLQA